MQLSNDQINKLLLLVASSEPDDLDCDGCFEQIAVFAEAELLDREVPEAMNVIKHHLTQCHCCEDEFNALLEGLRALEVTE